jgi:hypothetical protein
MKSLHIQRSEDHAGTMCGVCDDTEYMMGVGIYLAGHKAKRYRIHVGTDAFPFTEWCEECITSSDMAMYMLGTELA